MLRSMFAASLLTIGIAGAAQAMPVCYMEMHGVMTDLTHMCGTGEPVAVESVGLVNIEVNSDLDTAIADDRELPVLLEKRIRGSFLDIWVRNPRSTPSRETSAYYQAGYWADDEYEIVSGFIDVGGSTETRQRIRTNLRREHPSIPRDAELEDLYVDIQSYRVTP